MAVVKHVSFSNLGFKYNFVVFVVVLRLFEKISKRFDFFFLEFWSYLNLVKLVMLYFFCCIPMNLHTMCSLFSVEFCFFLSYSFVFFLCLTVRSIFI